MRAELDIPEHVRKLTFRPGSPADFKGKAHTQADLYLVELSSRKLLTVDGYPIQMNYMVRYFGDFFADRKRVKMFWSMATPEQMAGRRELLERDVAFQRLASADRELLAGIVKRDLSNDEIEREMQEIASLVGREKLVFVTHVNAGTPDNMPIEQRRDLINLVRNIAKQINVPCYDPTPLMRKLGQANAMENGGLDLTHYTDLFSDQLCEAWYASFVAPRIDVSDPSPVANAAGAQCEESAESLEAAWNAGRLCEASQRVREIIRKGHGSQQHQRLLGRMEYELGDYEGAIAQLESSYRDAEPDERLMLVLMQCYFETGQYSQACRLAAALMADERETPDILRTCAMSAEQLGDTETALTHWKRLFRLSQSPEAATAGIRLLTAINDHQGAAQWVDEVRETQPQHVPSFIFLWNKQLEQADRAGLLDLARVQVPLDELEFLDLARHAIAKNISTPAAVLAATHGVARGAWKAAADWLLAQAAQWLEQGEAALAADDLLQAADKIQARWQLNANSNTLIRARRSLERKMRQDVRTALLAKDYDTANRILTIASQTLVTFPEFDSFRIRVAEAVGDTHTAIHYLRRADNLEEVTSDVTWIKLARMASRSGHYGEAIDAYARVLSAKSSEPAARSDAKRQILSLKTRAIRLARDFHLTGDYEQAWALLERLQQFDPENRDVAQEKKRVLDSLYGKIKALDTTGDADRLTLGETILRLVPDDTIGLKAAAIGAMRIHRFDQALKYWQLLRGFSSSPELIDANIQKCRMWIDRAKRKKAA
jgi:tetratricopeptide (TPR) repeat protein